MSPQEIGSAITYISRYALSLALGLATEDDDDANHASGNTATRVETRSDSDPFDDRARADAEAFAKERGFDFAKVADELGIDLRDDDGRESAGSLRGDSRKGETAMSGISGGGRPKDGYRAADGERVPSVTGITGRAKDAGGLVYVAKKNWHEAGWRQLPFERDAYWGDPASWGTDALAIGSLVHDWIEDDLLGRRKLPFMDDASAEAIMGYQAYERWRSQVELEIVETEVPLVSEKHRFGGTLDAVAILNGERVLFDWKTSNNTYPDYIAQLAAYRELLRERGDNVDEGYLLRVGKEMGDFHVHFWPENVLDLGWEWFTAALSLYTLDKKLKKVAS